MARLWPGGTHETVAQAESGDPDHGAGIGRFDHAATPDVHGLVVTSPRTVKEEVTRLEAAYKPHPVLGHEAPTPRDVRSV